MWVKVEGRVMTGNLLEGYYRERREFLMGSFSQEEPKSWPLWKIFFLPKPVFGLDVKENGQKLQACAVQVILYLGAVPELEILGPLPTAVPRLLIRAVSITTLVSASVSSSVSDNNSAELPWGMICV